jgi:CTP synthase (UTP-ammonia lyase)
MTQQITPIDPMQDEDLFRCQQYVLMREITKPQPTLDEVAKTFGVTKMTLYRWVTTWKKNGLLPAVRRLLMTEIAEEIEESDKRLLAAVGAMTDRQIDIAITGKDFNATQAYNSLMPRVDKLREEQEATGTMEKDYIEGFAKKIDEVYMFDPLSIPASVPASAPSSPESDPSQNPA